MVKAADENFDKLEQYISQDDASKIASELVTCPELNTPVVGTICELSKNHAKSVFIPTADMVIDGEGLVYDAFIFCAANYVAQAAINKEFTTLLTSKASFYAPLKYGEVLLLEAQALFDETARKREVRVVGFINEIKSFESTMSISVTSEHIFHLKRPDSKENAESGQGEKKALSEEDKMLSALNAM